MAPGPVGLLFLEQPAPKSARPAASARPMANLPERRAAAWGSTLGVMAPHDTRSAGLPQTRPGPYSDARMSSQPVVAARGLSKSYGTFAAVSDVSFDVAPGEVFALLGPNGAGKTTLIRMLMDITRPDSGEVLVLGRAPDDSLKAKLGYLPEERGLYKRAIVGELLEFYARLKGHDGPTAGRLAR